MRDRAVFEIVSEINAKLEANCLPPLAWRLVAPWAIEETLVSDALAVREGIAQASDRIDSEEEA
jgi:hypothetical protein